METARFDSKGKKGRTIITGNRHRGFDISQRRVYNEIQFITTNSN